MASKSVDEQHVIGEELYNPIIFTYISFNIGVTVKRVCSKLLILDESLSCSTSIKLQREISFKAS